MSPAELKSIRHKLGLSVEQMASLVRVEGRTIRRWEDETREIPGTIDVLLDLLMRSQEARNLVGLTK